MARNRIAQSEDSLENHETNGTGLTVAIQQRVLTVLEALEEKGLGLAHVAENDPRWFFERFVKPMLPRNVDVSGDVAVKVTIIDSYKGDDDTDTP